MKINNLVTVLEENRKALCLSKRKIKSLLSREREAMPENLSKSINKTIDSMGRMIVDVYNHIPDYKVPFEEYSDDSPISRLIPNFRKGYDSNTEMSIVKGEVNTVLSSLDSIASLKHVLNPSDNSKLELSEKFFDYYRSAITSIDDTMEEAEKLFVVENTPLEGENEAENSEEVQEDEGEYTPDQADSVNEDVSTDEEKKRNDGENSEDSSQSDDTVEEPGEEPTGESEENTEDESVE